MKGLKVDLAKTEMLVIPLQSPSSTNEKDEAPLMQHLQTLRESESRVSSNSSTHGTNVRMTIDNMAANLDDSIIDWLHPELK